jgi:hypothetical protein
MILDPTITKAAKTLLTILGSIFEACGSHLGDDEVIDFLDLGGHDDSTRARR